EAEQSPGDDERTQMRQVHIPLHVPTLEHLVKAILEEVENVTRVGLRLWAHGVIDQKPAHVPPPESATRRVRVLGFVRMLMMHAMDGDPHHRRALRATRTKDGERMFQPARASEAAVSEQAMVAD